MKSQNKDSVSDSKDVMNLQSAIVAYKNAIRSLYDMGSDYSDFIVGTAKLIEDVDQKCQYNEEQILDAHNFFVELDKNEIQLTENDYTKYRDLFLRDVLDRLSRTGGFAWSMEGIGNPEVSIAVAIAYVLFFDPKAAVHLEFVRNKWEYRGDYGEPGYGDKWLYFYYSSKAPTGEVGWSFWKETLTYKWEAEKAENDRTKHSFEDSKTKEKKKKKGSKVPSEVRDALIEDLNLAAKNHSNVEELLAKYKQYFRTGIPDGYGKVSVWFLYDADVLLTERGCLYCDPKEQEYSSYEEEIKERLEMPPENIDLDNVLLMMTKLYLAKSHLEKVKDGDIVKLYREPDNNYDSNAVFVNSLSGDYLGYISGSTASYITPILERKKIYWRGVFIEKLPDPELNGRPGVKIELISAEKKTSDDGFFPVEISKPGLTPEENAEINKKMDAIIKEIKVRYMDKKIPKTIKTLKKHNPDLPIDEIRQWIAALNLGRIEDYLKSQGALAE